MWLSHDTTTSFSSVRTGAPAVAVGIEVPSQITSDTYFVSRYCSIT